MMYAILHDLITNPFAWILPAVMVASFLVNHKTPSSGDSTGGGGEKKQVQQKQSNTSAQKTQQKVTTERPADNGDAGLISADDTEST